MWYEVKTSVEKEKKSAKKIKEEEEEFNHNWQQYKKELDRQREKLRLYKLYTGRHSYIYMCVS